MAKKIELAPVAARDLQIVEYRGQRVVTTEQLAGGYGATEQMITNNFNRNKSRFVEGKHYFKLSGEDVEILRNSFRGVQNFVKGSLAHSLDRTRRGQPREDVGNRSGVELLQRSD